MYAKVYLDYGKMLAVADTFSFSAWLEVEMGKRGMSQADLARKAGVTRAAINGVLSGRRGPGTDLCNALARALDLPPETVFREAGLLEQKGETDEETEEMMYLFNQMTDDQQEQMIAMARFFVERREGKIPRQVRAEG